VDRVVALVPLAVGIFVVVRNRVFGDASVRSARRTFGREPGRHAHTAGRVIAVVVGLGMVAGGLVRLLGLA
jgi:hypothetical protein